MLLNGTDEAYRNTNNQLIGIANAWSFSMWVKKDSGSVGSNGHLVQVEADGPLGGDATNRIQIQVFSGVSPSVFVGNQSSSGGLLDFFSWNAASTGFAFDTWHHLVVTWAGTDVALYFDGSFVAPTGMTTNNPGSMTDTARNLVYGGERDTGGGDNDTWPGSLGHFAVWDVALGSAAATEIFNGKHSIDLRSDTGNYTSSADLLHYYRPGFSDLGTTDLAASPTAINFTAVNMDDSNIQDDAPC